MLAQYKENCIIQRKVYQWMERFQNDRTSITDDCLGHLSTSQIADNTEQFMLWFKTTDRLP